MSVLKKYFLSVLAVCAALFGQGVPDDIYKSNYSFTSALFKNELFIGEKTLLSNRVMRGGYNVSGKGVKTAVWEGLQLHASNAQGETVKTSELETQSSRSGEVLIDIEAEREGIGIVGVFFLSSRFQNNEHAVVHRIRVIDKRLFYGLGVFVLLFALIVLGLQLVPPLRRDFSYRGWIAAFANPLPQVQTAGYLLCYYLLISLFFLRYGESEAVGRLIESGYYYLLLPAFAAPSVFIMLPWVIFAFADPRIGIGFAILFALLTAVTQTACIVLNRLYIKQQLS